MRLLLNVPTCAGLLHVIYMQASTSCGWRRGSVVRMAIFGQWNFPDLCPIYVWG